MGKTVVILLRNTSLQRKRRAESKFIGRLAICMPKLRRRDAFHDANLERQRSRPPSNIGVAASGRDGTCVVAVLLAKVGFRVYTTRCG